MVLNAATLREYMTLTSITEIVDNQFSTAISDTTSILLSITDDEIALRYYSAYILAKSVNWKEIKKNADVEFEKPNPDTYLDLYNLRMDALTRLNTDNESQGTGMIVNSDPKYN